ncbi:putative membrane protein [Virus Rctr197k]|nr:putative membrane protein [Virus Rctr197k]
MKINHDALNHDALDINGINIVFHRTLRLPEDGKTHALPPSLGAFPLKRVDDYKGKVPPVWNEHGGLFLPLFQREALWLGFQQHNKPRA